jgi:hypothetical protein
MRDLKTVSVDQLVTETKLAGSAQEIIGLTTPEGWPFVVIIAVAKPGNERAVEFAKEFHRKMVEAARWTEVKA